MIFAGYNECGFKLVNALAQEGFMSGQTIVLYEKCAPIFSMLQDERRQEITQLLFENRELSVTALTESFSLSRVRQFPII